jgi:hypothetical protein
MFKRAFLICCALFGGVACCRAQSIYTTGIALSPSTLPPGGFNLEGHFEPGAPNVFGFGYTVYTVDSSLTLAFHGTTLGGVQPYFAVVPDGTVLDLDHRAPFGQSLTGYQLTLNQPFLVGMDMVNIQLTTVTAERFGWARLEYTSAGMQLLDEAVALGGNGIIAGTTTVLPEPSTICLSLSALLPLCLIHRRLSPKCRRHCEFAKMEMFNA